VSGFTHAELRPTGVDIVTTRHIQQRCPVCEGRKTVEPGFYTGLAASLNREPCQQCGGTGMIGATEVVTAVPHFG
jgi:hypothetical protein